MKTQSPRAKVLKFKVGALPTPTRAEQPINPLFSGDNEKALFSSSTAPSISDGVQSRSAVDRIPWSFGPSAYHLLRGFGSATFCHIPARNHLFTPPRVLSPKGCRLKRSLPGFERLSRLSHTRDILLVLPMAKKRTLYCPRHNLWHGDGRFLYVLNVFHKTSRWYFHRSPTIPIASNHSSS